MNTQAILNVIPKPARTAAPLIAVCAVLIGFTVGIVQAHLGTPFANMGGYFPILWIFAGVAGGLFIGCLCAVWVLGLGYVYGDARRRNMPAVPWVLVAALVPNLLGFLLYFVLRKPMARPCPHCGQSITPEQRFCSWCGGQQYAAPYGTSVRPPGTTGLDPGAYHGGE